MKLCHLLALLGFATADGTMPWETTPKPAELTVPVIVMPRLTPKDHAEAIAEEAQKPVGWAESASLVAGERLRAAKAGNQAFEHKIKAQEAELQASSVETTLLDKAKKVRFLRAQALEAARNTGRLISEIPDKIEQGVKKAVDEVVEEELKKLDEEKVAVMDAAKAKLAGKEAADAAVVRSLGAEAAEPFKKVKNEQLGVADSYSAAATKLAGQVNAMKSRAMELGAQAVQWQQRQNNMVKAEQVRMQATDLMEKAGTLSDEAKLYHNVADLANQEAGALVALGKAVPLDGDVAPAQFKVKLPEAPC
eukprot:TRINITY_DN93255_c0_g1_i1.p1 TRINITY_DN93255_c0_g1~~TRINITY_DN93255_c0_g1_i1.p1  ORF type:complete len:307 (+),score=95.51 TRINITY_DN93255_c0_g1_i1:69-989(+)